MSGMPIASAAKNDAPTRRLTKAAMAMFAHVPLLTAGHCIPRDCQSP